MGNTINKYMHLLNGRPAFYDGQQVCFTGSQIKFSELADSSGQIHKEYRLSENWRIDNKLTPYEWEHSFLRIKLDLED